MSDHTKGPWVCTATSHHCHDYRLTRRTGHIEPFIQEETYANAYLIAAAPDFLRLCEKLIGLKPDKFGYFAAHAILNDAFRAEIRAVIASAKGEEGA